MRRNLDEWKENILLNLRKYYESFYSKNMFLKEHFFFLQFNNRPTFIESKKKKEKKNWSSVEDVKFLSYSFHRLRSKLIHTWSVAINPLLSP